MARSSRSLWEIHVAVLLFGISGLFGKLLPLDASEIVLGRTVLGALTLGGWLIYQGNISKVFVSGQWPLNVLLGALLSFHWMTFFYSIQVSSVATGLLAFSSFPVFVTLLEPLIFQEKLRPRDLLTAAVVVSGLYLVLPENPGGDSAVVAGVAWGILSAFLFALLSLANRLCVRKTDPVSLAFLQNTGAALIAVPFVFRDGGTTLFGQWPLLLILGILCTALPHMLFVKALSSIKAQLASLICCLEPVYGILLAMVLIGETPSLRTVTGGAVMIGAIAFASLEKR